MGTSLMVEEECGTVTRTRHPHPGYYAGDFSGVPFHSPSWSQTATGAGLRTAHLAAWAPTS
jgi:hypothetical protein